MNYYEIIEKLCAVPAASGSEHAAADTVRALMEAAGLICEGDAMGNVFGLRRGSSPTGRPILLDAHFDEIGFIVTGHKKGFLRFDTLGGVDPRVLPARQVTLMCDPPRHGVFTSVPPHLQSAEEAENAFEKDKLYIDAGLCEEEAESAVPVGTVAVFSSGCMRLGGAFISGRALDDRAGLAALLGAIELLKDADIKNDVILCASVQEEVGCRGAAVAGYAKNPAAALAVDVTHGTTPDSGKALTFDLGSGSAIGVGPNFSRRYSEKLCERARALDIPHCVEVCAGESGTNAWPLQVSREGVATALLSIPLRYMHTPCEVLCERDLEATARLAAEFVHLADCDIQGVAFDA